MLIAKGNLVLPAGVNKGYFGTLTKNALAAFQVANGISPAVGYYGPVTAAKVNSMAMGGSMGGNTGNTGGNTGSGSLKGGAGDITVTEKSSGVKDEVLEGADEVKVLGFEVEAEGSDIAVTSVKVELEHTGSGSSRLNRYVDSVQIMMGNKVVGSADASDFSENSDVYSRSIALSNVVVNEDETEKLYVAVTALSNIDSNDLSEDWDVTVFSTRIEDATGAILTDSTPGITETFTFEDLASTGDVQLTVLEDDDSVNEAHTEQVSDTSDTNDIDVLSFELEADGSDLTVNTLIFDITSTGAGVTEIANDFRLMMDGEEVGTAKLDLNQDNDTTDAGEGTGFASSSIQTVAIIVTDLDDDDVIIESGKKVTFTLVADINDIEGAFTNGDSLSVALVPSSTDTDADDENGDAVTDLSGSADSTTISFGATGVMLDKGSSDTSARIFNLDTTSTDDQGKFEVIFDVTAFDEPAYIALTGTSSSAVVTAAGAYAYVESVNANDVAISTGTTTVTLERVSGGSLTGNYVKINAGQTATLKLTVYHDAATSGNYRAQLNQVNFATTAAAGATIQTAVPTSDYQSPSEQILN